MADHLVILNAHGWSSFILHDHSLSWFIAELQISPDLPVQQQKSEEALYLGGCRGRRCLYAQLGTRTNMSATEVE